MDELLIDVEKNCDFGPEITASVASSFLKTVNRPLSKESKSKLCEGIKIPTNCKEFASPKVNPEIWKMLPSNAKLSDVKHQQNQQALATGLSAFSIIADLIISKKSEMPKEIVSTVVKLSIDAANILGDQLQQQNFKRKMEIKKYLNSDYAGICSTQIPQSEWLFGDDINERLKTSKATSNLIKNTGIRGATRFHPYNKSGPVRQSSSGSLNYNRPFQQQQRT